MKLPSVQAVSARAIDLLGSLGPQERRAALRPFDDAARTDWHYIPRERPGVRLDHLREDQWDLAWDLFSAVLSATGSCKAQRIIQLEDVLAELTGEERDRYALIFFGDPARDATWSWRLEGHHLSLTFTIVEGEHLAVTPAFLGANPARVPDNHRHAGLRVLAREQDLAFELVQALDVGQREMALIKDRSLGDIVTGPGREHELRRMAGLPASGMTDGQRNALMALVQEYIGNMAHDVARAELARIREAGVYRINFAWAGSLTPGRPHYYRLHGPSLIIEYDNTQNDANHAHSVWHDPREEFGADLLRRHHEQSHKHAPDAVVLDHHAAKRDANNGDPTWAPIINPFSGRI
jgi:hypothetical protein